MTRKRKRKARKVYDRKHWVPSDPCMKCGAKGPHVVEYSHATYLGDHYKASCSECGAYQKFLGAEQAEPYVTGKPLWMLQDSLEAPY
jgi:hypothetical protein